jgi:hypothetical protein
MTDIAGEPGQTTPSAPTEADAKSAKRALTPESASPEEKGKPKGRKKKSAGSTVAAEADGAKHSRKLRGKRRQDLNQALVFELRTLRASLAQTLESIELRLGGRITELLHGIEGDPGLDQKPKPLTVKAAQTALAEADAIRIKPKRGRIKDIRRIDRTIQALRELQPKA